MEVVKSAEELAAESAASATQAATAVVQGTAAAAESGVAAAQAGAALAEANAAELVRANNERLAKLEEQNSWLTEQATQTRTALESQSSNLAAFQTTMGGTLEEIRAALKPPIPPAQGSAEEPPQVEPGSADDPPAEKTKLPAEQQKRRRLI